jgi:hypothetical protein
MMLHRPIAVSSACLTIVIEEGIAHCAAIKTKNQFEVKKFSRQISPQILTLIFAISS